jgi:LmeA-like phospholipid-binding
MTAPYTVPPPMMPPARARRTGRRVWVLVIVLLVLLGLLFGLDRAAAAYTANRIAAKLQAQGFGVKPHVSVEGFPFLTQLISRHLDGVEVTSPKVPVGPVTAAIDVHATNIMLDAGYQSGTIAQVDGTGLITFASLAKLPALAAIPGLRISSDGPHMVQLSANLAIFAATAIARVKLASPHEIALSLVSASGVPAALLDPIRHLAVQIPALPLGLTVQSVTVGQRGVVIRVSGSNVSFGQ